mmetsp:Transcript_21029/g.44637  ORF Transcript_21029/g.44637 Transcript_21029/m.44637 type:complete len:80 (+) Transcript_21029:490-729(+)
MVLQIFPEFFALVENDKISNATACIAIRFFGIICYVAVHFAPGRLKSMAGNEIVDQRTVSPRIGKSLLWLEISLKDRCF